MTQSRPPVLRIVGQIPAKKNKWRRKGAGVGVDQETQARLDWIVLQLREQWRHHQPLSSGATLTFVFETRNSLADRDNMYTTLLDCMIAARVIEDDRIGAMNGWHYLAPALTCENGREPVSTITIGS